MFGNPAQLGCMWKQRYYPSNGKTSEQGERLKADQHEQLGHVHAAKALQWSGVRKIVHMIPAGLAAHLYAPASFWSGENGVHGILSGVLQLHLQRKARIHLQHGLQQIHYPCSTRKRRLSSDHTPSPKPWDLAVGSTHAGSCG